MLAAQVAEQLQKLNYSILYVTEGDSCDNARVEINSNTQVQISHWDNTLSVLKVSDTGTFMIYPARKNFTDILSDLAS